MVLKFELYLFQYKIFLKKDTNTSALASATASTLPSAVACSVSSAVVSIVVFYI